MTPQDHTHELPGQSIDEERAELERMAAASHIEAEETSAIADEPQVSGSPEDDAEGDSAEEAAPTRPHRRDRSRRGASHGSAADRKSRSSFSSFLDALSSDEPPTANPPMMERHGVRYLDATTLKRPLDIPHAVKRGALAGMIAAAVIGAVILFFYFDAVVNAPLHEREQLEQNLSSDVAYDLPDVASLMGLDDASIMSTLEATGATLYEKTPVGTQEQGGFEVIKLPEGVSVADAGVMYLSGIDSLSASDAARLLNGSWDLTVTRDSKSHNINVRYAEFKAATVDDAIQIALESQGLTNDNITDTGVDESGNTYAAGTIERDGATYTWRISALELSEVYDISGLPSNSYYVGIRFTA